ncbi:glycoside hydrolase family 16 protein [Deinococcus maricopensis]|uniref:Glycoside hydrolase family 16 n=1 Tax=Deinococcus maricopensis (strain DSM 21211 / LMG 22137 / NRRL B-23946 / LB-34) TaxID=709986 RepID=E8U372_DEIML|nr:glycoside hydrolase family 16 protein [Deinococcus maricopensis]ADV66017.1 glycoside hydrolase family 16 [Deinococcus maricopensis DSM 21211]
MRRIILAVLALLPLAGTSRANPTQAAGWTDQFEQLDRARWAASDWNGFWQGRGLAGRFDPALAYADGAGNLVLEMNVDRCGSGWCARAAELSTKERYGYGRYEVRMRAASDSASAKRAGQAHAGNISAAFSYYDDSRTEIDVEIEGHRIADANFTAWRGRQDKDWKLAKGAAGGSLAAQFHTYAWEWTPGSLRFFVDGREQFLTRKTVPQDAAHLILNVWPTNDPGWGGAVQSGRLYMLVDYVKFTPAL